MEIPMVRWRLAVGFFVLLFSQIGVVSHVRSAAEQASAEPFAFLTGIDGVHQSQVVVASDGTMLLVWVQERAEELDLFVATRAKSGSFSAPLRINRAPVNSYTGDEARPDVALSPDGAVAIAWTAEDMNMMVAIGKNHGRNFSEPVRLNQDGGHAARTMPVVAFSSDGAVHAVWLDARTAPPGREEPANLFYARVEGGVVKESNLTASQKASVCGCCRPFISINHHDEFEIGFRNTTDAGYRDIFLIKGTSKGEFGSPQPTSPAIWEIGGCPSMGPVILDGLTLWKDGSKGFWRLLSSSEPGKEPVTILEEIKDELTLTYAPRQVSGTGDLVLVGGRPGGFILKRSDAGWKIVRKDLPAWASSAALDGQRLILVGNDTGRLRVAEMALVGNDE
jgi:hypothetical protein